MSETSSRTRWLGRLGVTNLPTYAAEPGAPPAATPDATPAAASPPGGGGGDAGMQYTVQQGAQVTAHRDTSTGAALPTEAGSQVQVGATYQAHPDGRAGLEVAATAAIGRSTDSTGQSATQGSVGVGVQYAAPVGPAIVAGQRITLTAGAGVNLGLSQPSGGPLSPQLQPFVGAQVAVPLSKEAQINVALQQSLTVQSGSSPTADTQVSVGLQIQIPGT